MLRLCSLLRYCCACAIVLVCGTSTHAAVAQSTRSGQTVGAPVLQANELVVSTPTESLLVLALFAKSPCTSAPVHLDGRMPRPASVQYRGVDLSPPNVTLNPSPPPGVHWWEDIPGQQLLTRGAGCASPSCVSLEFPKGTPNPEGAALCARNCSGSTSCVGWNMIRVTPTSGQRDKGPLCMLYTGVVMRTAPPFYHADGNFECGSKRKLQPKPPPAGGAGDGDLPQPAPCVTVIAANGSATQCCSGANSDSDLDYSAATSHSATWRLSLCRSSINVLLIGNISLQAAVAPVGATELVWMLLNASSASSAIEVRAVDLEFAFVGHASGTSFLTHQHKTWCEPGIGCEEWGGGAVQCKVGEDCSHQMRATQVAQLLPSTIATASVRGSDEKWMSQLAGPWEPPTPLSPAFLALLKPGRSAFIGASTGAVGYAGYSSQPTLPFQAFGSAHAGRKQQMYGAGAGRLHTNLRCGNVLPVTLKMGFFGDMSGDGTVSMDDAVIYSREQYPLADSVYRAGLVMKLDSDITSYTQNEKMGRITFNQTLDFIRNISFLADNTTIVLHLVGWQSSGHDTGYPSYDKINPNLGTSADLWRLAAEAKAYNTKLSYHINVDEAYKNLTATLGNQYSLHPVPGTDDGKPNPDYIREIIASMPNGSEWLWGADQPGLHSDPFQGGAYHISKTKDAASGHRWERLKRFLAVVPIDTTVHSDAYRDINDSWENDERGFISEDEEGICGLQADQRFWASHGLSFGVEGSNGCLCAVGPVPGFNSIVDYYWHGGASLGTWNRIIGGTAQGLDKDICAGGSSFAQPFDFKALGTQIYTKGLVYSLQMTDELISNGRFRGGGNQTHWPFGGSLIQYRQENAVFLPAVLPPTPGAAKTEPTRLSSNRVRVFSLAGGDLSWSLPRSWVGKRIESTTLTPMGTESGPVVKVRGDRLNLSGCARSIAGDSIYVCANTIGS